MERRKIKLFFVGCVLFIIGSAWLLFFYYKEENQNRIFVFPDSGFYWGDIAVEVKGLSGKESIYYTIDGKEPAEDWNNVIEYTEPITLHVEPEGKAYSFSFFCLSEDGTYLQCAERNYVVMEEGRKPNTDYVVCVQGDEEELFGYEEGIFVRGRRWDEYMEENPEVDARYVQVPANYLSDKEIEVHTAIFTGTGEEIISQDCGLRIYGNATRAQNQKSFRLISRFSYDSVNEFSYPFFEQLFSDNSNSCIQEYQRLSLHNAGNDNGYGFIRNTLCSELARQAGFPDVLVSCSAAVYINNHYMGVYWLQNTFDDRYFSEKYGYYPEGEMVICEGGMKQLLVYEEQDLLEKESAEAYNDFCNWLREVDVNDPMVWQRIIETIDVENLLQYVAIEYYVSNFDWPSNNVKVYRYQLENGGKYCVDGVFDGRYRYLLFDLDYGMGLIFFGWIGRDAYTEVLEDLCDPDQQAMVFAKIIERKECRDAFINEVINLGNGSFSKENVDRELERLNASRWNELEYMIEQTDILKDSLWEIEEISVETIAGELQSIRRFAEDRRARVLIEMMNMWDCGTLFQAEYEIQEEIRICINGQEVTEDSWYFAGIPITLSAETNSGIKIKGYEINGNYVEGDKVELLAEQYLEEGEKLCIVPEYEYVKTEQLSIQSFSVRGTQDWVTLENTGSIDIHLEDYFLSDDEDDFLKGRLPKAILKPGESITVYGGKYEGKMERGSFQVEFSWAKEEPVILAHLTEGIVELRNYH